MTESTQLALIGCHAEDLSTSDGCEREAEARLAEGHTDIAASLYERALTRASNHASSLEIRQGGDLNRAEQRLQRTLALLAEVASGNRQANVAPCISLTLSNLAALHQRSGFKSAALLCLREAEALCPLLPASEAAATHLSLCALLSQLSRHTEAERHAAQAVRLGEADILQLPSLNKAAGGCSYADGTALLREKASALAVAYNNLAVQREFLAQVEDCLPLYEKAVVLAEGHMDADNPLLIRLRESHRNALQAAKDRKTSLGNVRGPSEPPPHSSRQSSTADRRFHRASIADRRQSSEQTLHSQAGQAGSPRTLSRELADLLRPADSMHESVEDIDDESKAFRGRNRGQRLAALPLPPSENTAAFTQHRNGVPSSSSRLRASSCETPLLGHKTAEADASLCGKLGGGSQSARVPARRKRSKQEVAAAINEPCHAAQVSESASVLQEPQRTKRPERAKCAPEQVAPTLRSNAHGSFFGEPNIHHGTFQQTASGPQRTLHHARQEAAAVNIQRAFRKYNLRARNANRIQRQQLMAHRLTPRCVTATQGPPPHASSAAGPAAVPEHIPRAAGPAAIHTATQGPPASSAAVAGTVPERVPRAAGPAAAPSLPLLPSLGNDCTDRASAPPLGRPPLHPTGPAHAASLANAARPKHGSGYPNPLAAGGGTIHPMLQPPPATVQNKSNGGVHHDSDNTLKHQETKEDLAKSVRERRKKMAAARVLQRAWKLHCRHQSQQRALLLQSVLRASLQREQFACEIAAVRLLQRCYRSYTWRKLCRARLDHRRAASRSIQRFWRSVQTTRQCQQKMQAAATALQICFRHYLCVRARTRVRHRRESAATQVQAVWRMFVVLQKQQLNRLELRRHSAATRIQAFWRMLFVLQMQKSLRSAAASTAQQAAALALQKNARGFLTRRLLLESGVPIAAEERSGASSGNLQSRLKSSSVRCTAQRRLDWAEVTEAAGKSASAQHCGGRRLRSAGWELLVAAGGTARDPRWRGLLEVPAASALDRFARSSPQAHSDLHAAVDHRQIGQFLLSQLVVHWTDGQLSLSLADCSEVSLQVAPTTAVGQQEDLKAAMDSCCCPEAKEVSQDSEDTYAEEDWENEDCTGSHVESEEVPAEEKHEAVPRDEAASENPKDVFEASAPDDAESQRAEHASAETEIDVHALRVEAAEDAKTVLDRDIHESGTRHEAASEHAPVACAVEASIHHSLESHRARKVAEIATIEIDEPECASAEKANGSAAPAEDKAEHGTPSASAQSPLSMLSSSTCIPSVDMHAFAEGKVEGGSLVEGTKESASEGSRADDTSQAGAPDEAPTAEKADVVPRETRPANEEGLRSDAMASSEVAGAGAARGPLCEAWLCAQCGLTNEVCPDLCVLCETRRQAPVAAAVATRSSSRGSLEKQRPGSAARSRPVRPRVGGGSA
eukprot:TRINITY_DN5954_c0_g1_i3.p1 TRINITY_DN5954_c0_g1~~TRINITY_DN5954_c0_g1_i3.p1  ORF type:complete len:1421 (-),score=275.03 TRINITY_DN5954_c0_g1_i3:32-4294(-)